MCLKHNFLVLIAFAIHGILMGSSAQAAIGHVCDQKIVEVARDTSVPAEILYRIARLETGRTVDGEYISWPWALNNGGAAYFMESKTLALKKLRELRGLGKTNIDVGCMQLNVKWHAKHFESYETMMDPYRNIRYAARYLEELYQETGTWEKAVRYYHSRNSKYHNIYFAKFKKIKAPSQKALKAMAFAQAASTFTNAKEILPLIDLNSGASGSIFQAEGTEMSPVVRPLIAFSDIREFSVAPLINK